MANAQQNNRQDFSHQTHPAQPPSTDFRTNSNDIHGQPNWRPCPGAPPQRGSNHSWGAKNYFYEGNPLTCPNDFVQNTYTVDPNTSIMPPWEQHIHYNAAPALCIDNLTPSSKTFIHKYTSRQAIPIPVKIGPIKAHALIVTGAQCSILSSGLVKGALNKQLLQLPICGKIKVTNSAVVNAHGPVVLTMESAFGEHMIKCVILDKDSNDQCIIRTDFLAHPNFHAILNFKDNYIEIQEVKLLLKVITSVRSQTELFLNAVNDNVLKEIPEQERVATTTANRDLTDHEPAALNKSLPCHTDQQKLDFALNKMTTKTYIAAAQKSKALRML
uniref:Peptidase A2 domain-containing protein n=1 Tax=Romanomermis culicivorax TaxID=13658 RepID=A0A915HVJ8_ROMCU